MNLNSSVCKNLQTGINLAAYKPNHELQFIFIKATGSLLCPPWTQSWYWFPCNITCLSTGIITITWASSGICQLSWSGNHSRLMCGNHGKSLCSITDDSAAVSIKTIRQLYLATAQVIEGKQATTCSIMSPPPPPPNHSRVYWGEGISHIPGVYLIKSFKFMLANTRYRKYWINIYSMKALKMSY